MSQRINSLETLVSVKDDLEKRLLNANQLIDKLQESKERLQRELETASDYLLE